MAKLDWEKAKRQDGPPRGQAGKPRPATKKQLAFLNKLGDQGPPPLTKSSAQSRIDKALNVEKRKRNAKMATEPPSERQVKALKKFGLEVPATSLEASDLIGPKIAEVKRGRRRTKWQKQELAKCEITFVDPSTLRRET